MKRLMLLIAVACLLVAGCDVTPGDSSTVSSTSSQPRLYSLAEMKDLRVRVGSAATDVALAKAAYDQGCPPEWRSQPNPDSDLCEPMKAHGLLVKEILDAENTCRELVDEYNDQVRRGAPNEGGEIIPGSSKDSAGKVISCSAE